MALFKILKGDSSRISTDITPFHDGYAYFSSNDGGLYIDAVVNGVNKRIRINPSYESRAVYATLSASAWSGGEQVISVAGLTSESNGVVGLDSDATEDEMSACADAGLYVAGQANGALTIGFAGDAPTEDIPVVVLIMG